MDHGYSIRHGRRPLPLLGVRARYCSQAARNLSGDFYKIIQVTNYVPVQKLNILALLVYLVRGREERRHIFL